MRTWEKTAAEKAKAKAARERVRTARARVEAKEKETPPRPENASVASRVGTSSPTAAVSWQAGPERRRLPRRTSAAWKKESGPRTHQLSDLIAVV